MYIALVVSELRVSQAQRRTYEQRTLRSDCGLRIHKSLWTINRQVVTIFDWLVSEYQLRPIDERLSSLCETLTCRDLNLCVNCLLSGSTKHLARRFAEVVSINAICSAYGVSGRKRTGLVRAITLVATILDECAQHDCGLLVVLWKCDQLTEKCC